MNKLTFFLILFLFLYSQYSYSQEEFDKVRIYVARILCTECDSIDNETLDYATNSFSSKLEMYINSDSTISKTFEVKSLNITKSIYYARKELEGEIKKYNSKEYKNGFFGEIKYPETANVILIAELISLTKSSYDFILRAYTVEGLSFMASCGYETMTTKTFKNRNLREEYITEAVKKCFKKQTFTNDIYSKMEKYYKKKIQEVSENQISKAECNADYIKKWGFLNPSTDGLMGIYLDESKNFIYFHLNDMLDYLSMKDNFIIRLEECVKDPSCWRANGYETKSDNFFRDSILGVLYEAEEYYHYFKKEFPQYISHDMPTNDKGPLNRKLWTNLKDALFQHKNELAFFIVSKVSDIIKKAHPFQVSDQNLEAKIKWIEKNANNKKVNNVIINIINN